MKPGDSPVFSSWLRLPLTFTDVDGRFALTGLTVGTEVVVTIERGGPPGNVPGEDSTSPLPVAARASIDRASGCFTVLSTTCRDPKLPRNALSAAPARHITGRDRSMPLPRLTQ